MLHNERVWLSCAEVHTPAGLAGDTWMHNISASYTFTEMGMQVFGGVNNLSDVKPFITERAYPASPIGRSFFIGARWTL